MATQIAPAERLWRAYRQSVGQYGVAHVHSKTMFDAWWDECEKIVRRCEELDKQKGPGQARP